MFYYFRNILFSDEDIFVNYDNNNRQPSINEYNLYLFPKSNIHNLKNIEKIKNILKSNEINYISIIISNIIYQILNSQKGLNISNFYSISLKCSYNIKRILIYKVNNIEIPQKKIFNSIQIDKSEIKNYIDKIESEKQENGFNLNFENKKEYKSIIYKPLRDKYLKSFMQSPTHINVLKSHELISSKKKILIKRTISPQTNTKQEKMLKSFLNFISSKDIKEKNKDYMKEFMKRKQESKYYIPGVNSSKEYYCYLGKKFKKKFVFPNIKRKLKFEKKNQSVHIIEKNINVNCGSENILDNLKEKNYGLNVEELKEKNNTNELKDISIYKEIIFNKTPLK